MTNLNFVISEMTFWRYFIPLIDQASKMGIKSNVFIVGNDKYNNVFSFLSAIEKLAQKYDFNIFSLDVINDFPGVTFLIESCMIDSLDPDLHKINCVTYMTDYRHHFKNYIDRADHVFIPSFTMAKEYQTVSDKNRYFGSPKYDVVLDKETIRKKYGIKTKKPLALFMFPRTRDLTLVPVKLIYDALRDEGYDVLTKTRGKDPVAKDLRGDYYLSDNSWFPHTSMELITISDVAINFGSTTSKECALLKLPLVNFSVKKHFTHLKFLHKYDFFNEMGSTFNEKDFKRQLATIRDTNFIDEFKKCWTNDLFDPNENVSQKILQEVL